MHVQLGNAKTAKDSISTPIGLAAHTVRTNYRIAERDLVWAASLRRCWKSLASTDIFAT